MIENCWNQIGVRGDRSCPELKTFIHCRNCPVYSTSGRNLLARKPPPGYLQEWTNVLAREIDKTAIQASRGTVLAIVFRLGREWLALPAGVFKEVTQPCVVRTLPHRSNEILLGIANIRGEIIPCISLKNFLGIEEGEGFDGSLKVKDTDRAVEESHRLTSRETTFYNRMVVLERGKKIWVFHVDDMSGTYRCCHDEIQDSPISFSRSKNCYVKGIVELEDRKVNYLDENLLFEGLDRQLL